MTTQPTLFNRRPLPLSPAVERARKERDSRPKVERLSVDTWESKRLARRTDPESSKRAAERVVRRGIARGHEALIVETLRAAGHPLNAKEIGGQCGLTNVRVCRRTGPEGRLRREGLIRVVGKRDGEQAFEVAG